MTRPLARQFAAGSLTLAMSLCAAPAQPTEPASPPPATVIPPRPFRTAQIEPRDFSSDAAAPVDSRSSPAPKPAAEAADFGMERLDPFPRPKPRPIDPDAPTEAVEPAMPIEREEVEERDKPKEAVRTPQVDRAQMFRNSVVPRDIMEVPGAGVDAALTRLSEERSLFGKRWSVNAGAYVSAVFDDNVTVAETDKQSDILFTLGANVAVRLGTDESDLYLIGSYGIGYVRYLESSYEASVDQNFSLSARYRFTKLTIGTNISMSLTSGGTVDVGERVRRDNYFGSIYANYAFTEKLAFDLTFTGNSSGYEDLLSARDTRIRAFVDYALTPKLKIGLGGAYGTTKQEEGSDQTVQQVLARFSYTVTGKLTMSGDFGLEMRETGAGDEVSPVFSLGAAYRPFERTTLTFEAHRRIFSSASLFGQDYTATGAVIGVRQELLPRLGISFGGGYEFTEYFGTEAGVVGSREDRYFFLRTSLDWEIARWCRLGVFYEYTQSDSSGEGSRSFDRNRAGVQVSMMY